MAALALAGAAAPALAGPPYLTDDPIPTGPGHWEIYAFTAGEGRGSSVDADTGLDLNYGPVKDIQLTATLPLSFSHEPHEGWRGGTGDVELGVKYRFFDDERSGVSAAIFPRAILPTSSLAHDEKTRILLPLWVGKDFAGGTSVFGGGGYEINRGAGNRDFWQAAAAVTHDLSKQVSVGAEVTRQGADTIGGTAQTRAGVGSIVKLGGPYALLFSGGPTWADHRTGFHFYGALGLNF
jgi:hypothetical protein